MAAVTNYIILPFLLDKRGKLKAGTAQKAKDCNQGHHWRPNGWPGKYAGIVVLEEQCDPEQDIFAEPRLGPRHRAGAGRDDRTACGLIWQAEANEVN